MDYIQQELRRQQTALKRLLLGKNDMEGETERQRAASPSGEPFSVQERTIPALALQNGGGDGRPAAAGESLREERLAAAEKPAREERSEAARLAATLDAAEIFQRRGELTELRTLLENAAPRGQSLWNAPETGGTILADAEGKTESFPGRDAPPREVLTGKSAGTALGSTVTERVVTEVAAAPSARGDGPEALSRAFQRDARRYDGGFVPY